MRAVHRELLLPSPTKDPPEIAPLVWKTSDPFWLEIHREKDGRVRYALGSIGALELDAMLSYLESVRPRIGRGDSVECLAKTLVPEGLYARAVPALKHHHLPLEVQARQDTADHLLRIFGSSALRGHDVVLQTLFQNRGWESTFLSPLFDSVAARQDHPVRARMHARSRQAAYRFELRAHITGPKPNDALSGLGVWLRQWTTATGATWRDWKIVPPRKEWSFHAAFVDHDIRRFASRKARRDVSGSELAHLLCIPWSTHHPECSYSGAPRGQPGPDLLPRPILSPRPHLELRLIVGLSGLRPVALPKTWNHAAVVGRTQSGKSTLALSLALQILRKQPESTVVVMEPTGTLVEGIVSRLSHETASETIEIDPAHSTFQQGDSTMVSVPLSLLLPPEQANEAPAARDRWSEALAGDLLAAIRSAWGEESIGGRAEFVLRALVQGLALTPGSNLVDAYHILTSKPALQRFVKSAPPGPLRDFLEHHLPRLDYNFTMSSLDKVGKIATNPLLRIALCQRDHSVSFDRLLGHRLLLLNLSKAALGADGANFLGAIYLTQLWAAVQRSGRADRPVYLVLDEVHNYAVPALADMLSEGAKFGLHVVAITQYLHRVPPRIRAALLGNVDGWLLFSLGTEDMDDAWKIVNGENHGWLPQDLVDGLRPHEVAMSVSGDLLKLATRPSPAPASQVSNLKEIVASSSRRYAQPEDSRASPWLVGQNEVEILLGTLTKGPQTREELAQGSALPPDRFDGALALATVQGDVERESGEGKFQLTARGTVHLEALRARRNDGEDHVGTVTDIAMFLKERGIAMDILAQVAGVLLPDGQFRWGDATYNVEVECSTLLKAAEQVVRNVKKGREAGNRVLIALPDRSGVPRVQAVLDTAFPGMRLWQDGIGLVWKDEDGGFRPQRVQGTQIWPFLEPAVQSGVPVGAIHESGEPQTTTDTDPLLGLVRTAIRELIAFGKKEATSRELLEALPPTERLHRTEHQVAIALSALGLVRRRVRLGEERPRVYDLLTLHAYERTDKSATEGGPVQWIDPGTGSTVDEAGRRDRSADSSSRENASGPDGPDGPDD
ncbi:MAG: hypothetical protein ACLQAS_03610 [Thermoplasmata archaeon]